MILESDEEKEEWAEVGGVAVGNKGGDEVTKRMEMSMNDEKEKVLKEVITYIMLMRVYVK